MKVGMIGARPIAGIMTGTIKEMDCAQSYVAAVRNYGRAAESAQRYGPEEACGSYEELVKDAGVELVHIATPHPHHCEHIKLCLSHGKHILCEKFFTVNESQAREVLGLAGEKKLLLTEAIWTRYMPVRKTLDDVLSSGVIDRPYMLTVNLGYIISGKERIIRPELAGGVLLNVEVYPLSSVSMMFRGEMDIITGAAVMAGTGVDAQNSITITCKDDRMVVLCSSAMGFSDHRGIIYDDNGFTGVENINSCEGTRIYDRPRNMITSYDTLEQISEYEYEVEACLWAIEEGALECPEMPHKETLRTMGRMDELCRQWGLVYPMER